MSGRFTQALMRYVMLLMLLVLTVFARANFGQELERKYGLYPDYPANIRLQMIGQRMAQAANAPTISFRIFNDDELNAMALPDGRIYVTSLMATVVTDDELAYVLGHEITHITEKHAKSQTSRATGGAILGAILAAALGGDESDIRLGADIVGGLTYGHYSRRDERRADSGGVKLMARAGYDQTKAASAMQRLIDKYGRGDANFPILGWFATHPDSKSRKARLEEDAVAVAKKPPQKIAAPLGVTVELDPSAEHAREWVLNYLTYLISAHGQGRVVLLTPAPALAQVSPTPVETPMVEDAATDGKDKPSKKDKEKEPLPPVKVVIPNAPVGYRLTVSLQRIPAGGAANLDESQGTAVEARVQWTQVAGGLSGACTAIAQTTKDVPWMAQEQLAAPEALTKLADGRERNIEGTLEATALRRAMMAFAEIVEAGGPIDHGAPVTIKMSTAGLRPNDYVYVVRGDQIVAEVCVTQLNKKDITGTVLWGTHTWKRGDRFVGQGS